MPAYAVGDLQGCQRTFQRLLRKIGFDPAQDRLLLVGDLVNRGPRSLEVLRWVVAHEEVVTAVLGNHDLHLLAVAAGRRRPRPPDTLRPILEAPDREPLLDWLRRRPLLAREGSLVLVHAGLLPSWTVEHAAVLAAEAEAALRRDEGAELWDALARPLPEAWDETLEGSHRSAFVAAVLTRLRTCSPDDRPCFDYTGPPAGAPPGCLPWFRLPHRRSSDHSLVFGHWAALGLVNEPRLLALDTGCVWGNRLTAVRLEDRAVFSEPFAE